MAIPVPMPFLSTAAGANCSDNYFTTRQDRYMFLRNVPQLANYLDDLLGFVGHFSYR